MKNIKKAEVLTLKEQIKEPLIKAPLKSHAIG